MKSRKGNKRNQSVLNIIGIVALTIVIFVAAIFTFVPMSFGQTTYTGVWGAIGMSSDVYSGLYAEYDIVGKPSHASVESSIAKIKDVLNEEGYESCKVYSIDDKKIRVEIGYPQTVTNTFSSAYSVLSTVDVGAFQLRSSSGDDAVVVDANKHLKDVSINDYNGTTYLVLEFNSDGEAKLEELVSASSTIYVYMGDSMQTSFDGSNISDYSTIQLSITDYSSAKDFYYKVLFGSISVELNGDTTIINSMTSPFAFSAKEGSSVMLSVLVSFIFTLLVVAMVYLGTKYGMIAVILLPLLLLDAIIVCWLFAGISAIEISIVSLIAIILGMVLLFCGTINFASRVAEEYALGKTIDASLESGSKKARPAALISNAFVVVFTFIMFLFVKGEVASASIILCIFGLLNILTNVILLPWLVKSYNKTNKNQGKPYRLKQVEVITND